MEAGFPWMYQCASRPLIARGANVRFLQKRMPGRGREQPNRQWSRFDPSWTFAAYASAQFRDNESGR